jgi:energy-coupling factor transporter ATP-binding protein EcfA2
MKHLWSALRDRLPLMPGRARRFLAIYVVPTAILALFDVAAMSLLALVISPVASGAPVVIPILGELPADATPWLLLVACGLIIAKNALAVAMYAVTTRQFAIYEHEIGRRMFRAYLGSSWEERSKRRTVEFTRIADTGISVAISGLVLWLLTIAGNFLTIALTLIVLIVAQPVTALLSLAYLGLGAVIINQVVTKRTLRAAQDNLDLGFRVARLLTEMVEALKEPTLFDGSIGQNVALTWDEDNDTEEVMRALEKAQLSSLVASREHGIDERMGKRGVTLSGVQQQRLGIARGLYSDPLVLVLDAATSSLDTKTEDDVVRALKALHDEVTLIAVAHRTSTIKDYDQICYRDSARAPSMSSPHPCRSSACRRSWLG